MKPFTQQHISSTTFLRTFDDQVNESELTWHFDQRDRVVSVIENKNWKIQFDNCLPMLLEGVVHIPKNRYHRLLRGEGQLKVLISESID